MVSRRATESGLLCLAGAFALSLVGFALPFLWNAVIEAARIGQPLLASLRTVWIPVSGLALDAVIGILGIVGFGLLWRGRWELGAERASRMGLPLLALLVASVAYTAYTLTGVLLGFVSGVGFLAPWHAAFAFAGAVVLGAALYGTLALMPVPGSRVAAAVAFALGVAGSALLFTATLGLRRSELLAAEGAGYGLSVASVILWLILCVWDANRLPRRPSVPGRSSSASQN